MAGKERMQFDFTKDQIASIDRIVEATGSTTRAEAMRKALKFSEWLSGVDPEAIIEVTDMQGNIVHRSSVKLLRQ